MSNAPRDENAVTTLLGTSNVDGRTPVVVWADPTTHRIFVDSIGTGTTTPGGLSIANFTSGDTYTALTSTAQVIKASAGNLYGYYMYNPNATATYVLVYNIAAASVTVGTSTASLVFCLPEGAAANVNFPIPIPFSNTGWSIAAATTGGGNSAPSTPLEVMIYYL